MYLSPFLCSLAWQPDPLDVWNWNAVIRGESSSPLLILIRDPCCRNLRIWCCLLCALEGEQEEVVQAREESRANTPQCSHVFDVFVARSSVGSRWALVLFCLMAAVALQVLRFWDWSWLRVTSFTLPALLHWAGSEMVHIRAPASLAMEQDKRNSSCCSRGKEICAWVAVLGGNCLPAITFCHSQDFSCGDTAPFENSGFKLTG